MADERRETEVVRDPETGRVTSYVEHHVEERPKKSGGGWLLGLILGALLVVGGIAIYANNQGGFQQAGVEADRAVEQAQTQTGQAAEQAGDAFNQTAQNAGEAVENAGDQVQNSMN